MSEEQPSKVKNKEKKLKEITTKLDDLDQILDEVRKLDTTCSFTKCKKKTNNFNIHCKYCNQCFCTTHGLPEIHGCGEAVRNDEKRKFLHPDAKLSKQKHSEANTKLQMKLKQMQSQRKGKQGGSGSSSNKN